MLEYALFIAFVLVMLAVDLGVHKDNHVIGIREALGWSAFWIALAFVFNGWILYNDGRVAATEFLTGYLIEKSLSVDNLFVFLTLFAYFRVPAEYQHRVLFWGVLGALLMRGAMIAAGAVLLERFHWLIYVFGAFLAYTGFKMAFKPGHGGDPGNNPAVRLARRLFPVTDGFHGDRFFVGKAATPLFLVVVAVEFTDLVFAVDSIPAIFAVTRDPYIVFTSNVFAILGLRSLYFALANVVERFWALRYGLAGVLVFVGLKMCLMGFYKIPAFASLGVVTTLLAGSVVFSLAVRPGPAAPSA